MHWMYVAACITALAYRHSCRWLPDAWATTSKVSAHITGCTACIYRLSTKHSCAVSYYIGCMGVMPITHSFYSPGLRMQSFSKCWSHCIIFWTRYCYCSCSLATTSLYIYIWDAYHCTCTHVQSLCKCIYLPSSVNLLWGMHSLMYNIIMWQLIIFNINLKISEWLGSILVTRVFETTLADPKWTDGGVKSNVSTPIQGSSSVMNDYKRLSGKLWGHQCP